MPTDIDPDKFEEIQNSGETWIIDFWAEWCNPCQKYKPIFEEVAGEFDSVNFGKVPVHAHKEIAQKMGVRALPTTIVLSNGDETARSAGVMDSDELKKWVEENT